jgi:DTW domain-containing protein YfiP
MHTEEAKYQRTGTGRLAHLMLAGSRLLVGRDFTGDPEVERLASDPAAFPCVLFPAPDALDLSRGGLGAAALGGRALRVFVADGTWRQAGALLRRSAPLAALPRITFAPPFRSGFAFKRQPKPEALSTIEALYCLLAELERLGLARPEGRQQDLLRVFRRMVDRQLVHVPPQGRGAPR